MANALVSWNQVIVIGMWLGWGLALAGAILRTVSFMRTQERLAAVATALYGLALLLFGAGLLLAGVSGPAPWVQPVTSAMLAVAGASMALLFALVLHPTGSLKRHQVFDLVLAWLIVAVGVCGCVLGMSVISI